MEWIGAPVAGPNRVSLSDPDRILMRNLYY